LTDHHLKGALLGDWAVGELFAPVAMGHALGQEKQQAKQLKGKGKGDLGLPLL